MCVEKLTLSQEDLESGVGYLQQYSVRDTYPLHTHKDFFEVFYIQRGRAIHKVNGESQLLSNGSFVLVRPDDIHQYEFLNTFDIELISCGISMEVMEKACKLLGYTANQFCQSYLPPHTVLSGFEFGDVVRKLTKIPEKEEGVERKQYFLSILPQFLYLFMEKDKGKSKTIPIWLSKLLEIMNEREFYIGGLPKLLEASNISQEHLTRELKKHVGLTPTQLINIKRMNYAAELLLDHKHEIVEICYMCGYNNLSYFYQTFKKNFNCSPKEFIERRK